MSRYYWNRKRTAEESCDLSIYRIRKMGLSKKGGLSENLCILVVMAVKSARKEPRQLHFQDRFGILAKDKV